MEAKFRPSRDHAGCFKRRNTFDSDLQRSSPNFASTNNYSDGKLSNADTYSNSNSYAYSYSNANTNTNTNTNTYSYANTKANAYSNPDSEEHFFLNNNFNF
jgi:hypothetical protein